MTSRPVVGSSSTTTFGLAASAIAIATRCCWPPLSSNGYRRSRAASSSPTRRGDLRGRSLGRCFVRCRARAVPRDLRIDAVTGIEARIWVLGHIGDLRPAGSPPHRGAQLQEVGAVEHRSSLQRSASLAERSRAVRARCSSCRNRTRPQVPETSPLATSKATSSTMSAPAVVSTRSPSTLSTGRAISHRVLRSSARRCARRRRR